MQRVKKFRKTEYENTFISLHDKIHYNIEFTEIKDHKRKE